MQIEATDVRKTYGSVTALDGLSLSIPSGSTFGLLGTNGAGKTTLFRLLIGHDAPDEGTVRIGDTTVSEAGPGIRQRVGYLPERVGFPDELTAREVLLVSGRVRGLDDVSERAATVLETVGLGGDADRPVEGFSNGMRRRLGLATALLPDPDVLLLDEPTAGLDPLGVAAFHRIVEDVSERTGATVLVCSHALAEIERLCDRAAVLDDGGLLALGDLGDLTAAGDGTRRVRIPVADAEDRQIVAETCRQFGEPGVTDEAVTVDVPDDDLADLLSAVDEVADLGGVELGSRGLEAAFESIVAGGGAPTAELDESEAAARPADATAAAAPEEGSP